MPCLFFVLSCWSFLKPLHHYLFLSNILGAPSSSSLPGRSLHQGAFFTTGRAMAPANGDAAGPSSSQDGLVATMKKRNKPQCNLSSYKEGKFCFFSPSGVAVIWGLGCLLPWTGCRSLPCFLTDCHQIRTWCAANWKTAFLFLGLEDCEFVIHKARSSLKVIYLMVLS